MVQRTPLYGIPWVEPSDIAKTYPTISEELATDIEALIQPIVLTNAVTPAAGLTAFTSRLIIRKPTSAELYIQYTHGGTSVPAGETTQQIGTLNDNVAHRTTLTVAGAFRMNNGGGIFGLNTGGTVSLKWLSSVLSSGHIFNGVLVYELTNPYPLTMPAP